MNEREREIIEVSLDDIIPNRFQPRLSFDEQGLNELAESIIDIVLGFVVVCNVSSIEKVLPLVLGIWIILEGILKLQIAFNIRGVRDTKWGLMLILSLVSIALGVAVMLNPATSFEVIIKISGVVLLVTQLFNIYDDVYILTQIKEVEKAVKDITSEEKTKNK